MKNVSKATIQRQINALDFAMNHLSDEVDKLGGPNTLDPEDEVAHYAAYITEQIVLLDDIREELAKKLWKL